LSAEYHQKTTPDEADSLLALGDCYWALGDQHPRLYFYKLFVTSTHVSLPKSREAGQACSGIHAYEEGRTDFPGIVGFGRFFEEVMFVYNSYSKNKSSSESPSGAEAQSQGGAFMKNRLCRGLSCCCFVFPPAAAARQSRF
jgi:hypothetical protein